MIDPSFNLVKKFEIGYMIADVMASFVSLLCLAVIFLFKINKKVTAMAALISLDYLIFLVSLINNLLST